MKILESAVRQYRHSQGNDNEFVFGYDKEETEKIVEQLLSEITTLKLFADYLVEELKKG